MQKYRSFFMHLWLNMSHWFDHIDGTCPHGRYTDKDLCALLLQKYLE